MKCSGIRVLIRFPFDSELVSLYVKPSEIGHGIGTALFEETCKHLKELGNKNMVVWCLSDNKRSIRFYKKMGEKIVKTKNAKIGDKYCIIKKLGFIFI